MENTGKDILVKETAGISRSFEYVRVAVPWARGDIRPNTPLRVTTPAGHSGPCQHTVLKQWPDGSVKWMLVDFAVAVPAGNKVHYRLSPSSGAAPLLTTAVRVIPGADAWQVDTGTGLFSIDARTFRPFTSVRLNKSEVIREDGCSCQLSIDGKTVETPIIEDIQLENSGPLRAVIRLNGQFAGPGIRFHARLHFYAGSMAIQVEFTIHNPQAASHPDGLWDLGDSGSFLFRELAFEFPFVTGLVTEVQCSTEICTAPLVYSGIEPICIYQESSGGENWQNPIHRNREGRVPLSFRGYIVEANGRQSASGLRATPLVWCGTNRKGVAAVVPFFWQEFPKAIEANKEQLTISLFPACFPDMHELQGGEQKTHLVCLDFAAEPGGMGWALSPLQSHVSPHDYHSSGIFHDLPADNDLIDSFSTVASFIAKRETGDEYGWRNFGDIHADHEAVYYDRAQQFVSHYNNQYDFCAGAYRKSFATGDPQWGNLAAELARHVLDIDIYHTDLDREEYNRGLFWHTDHYIDAGLSSHRSYSREHLKTKEPCFCGGGPNAEHCYTTGLMLHYFQTGDPAFREAVIKLAEWGVRSLDGPQTLLAAFRRGLGYLSDWRSLQGSRRMFPSYPLNRGTGNAINACLDAFEVGGGKEYLLTAEKLIRGSLHPDDDIESRNLLDAERAWSYTVLLVAVAKFMDMKYELDELDDGFSYARACLLAYAEWMERNEYPYMDKPEILEYPNETWPAQDIRKSVIFYHASRYAGPEWKEVLRQKALHFFAVSRDELLRHETSRFSRPLTLLLQNGWVGARLTGEGVYNPVPDFPGGTVSGPPTPYLGLKSVAKRICSEVARAMIQTSLRKETNWLRMRVGN